MILIDSGKALAGLTGALKQAGRISLDTEADSMHHYFEKVCLVQLSLGEENYIVDPLAGLDLTGFFEILAEKELVIHASDNDLRQLKKSYGFRPKGEVFDTLLGAQLLGYEKIGLAALVERFYGVVLSKSSQRADWSMRPLPQKMLDYAVNDTKYLEGIARKMQEELAALGRTEWHRECCERIVKNLDAPEKIETEPRDEWRVKGSSLLPPHELAFVRELWKWRDAEARRKDRPPFMILRNEDLIETAQWRAKNHRASLADGPASLKRFQGEVKDRLESALQAAESLAQSEWPAVQKKRPWYLDLPKDPKVGQLADACKAIAEKLKVQSLVIATNAVFESVVKNRPETAQEMVEKCGVMRWQAEILMPAVKDLKI